MPSAKRAIIGGIATDLVTATELAGQMLEDCRESRLAVPKLIFYANGFTLSRYHADPSFRRDFDQANIVVADGAPHVLASRCLSALPLPERIAITDFIHVAAEAAAQHSIRFFLLGASEEANAAAAHALTARYPNLIIAGRRNGYFEAHEEAMICSEIVSSGTDVLWVGLGSPLQESFALRNRERLVGVAWLFACGGLFDHLSGRYRRAPGWAQSAGLEWIFRAVQEPRRLGIRYLRTNIPAAFHLVTKTR